MVNGFETEVIFSPFSMKPTIFHTADALFSEPMKRERVVLSSQKFPMPEPRGSEGYIGAVFPLVIMPLVWGCSKIQPPLNSGRNFSPLSLLPHPPKLLLKKAS